MFPAECNAAKFMTFLVVISTRMRGPQLQEITLISSDAGLTFFSPQLDVLPGNGWGALMQIGMFSASRHVEHFDVAMMSLADGFGSESCPCFGASQNEKQMSVRQNQEDQEVQTLDLFIYHLII